MTEPIQVTVHNGTAQVNGQTVRADGDQTPHQAAIHYVARRYAEPAGQAVPVTAHDDEGTTTLTVNPDGTTSIDTSDDGDSARPPVTPVRTHPSTPTTTRALRPVATEQPSPEPPDPQPVTAPDSTVTRTPQTRRTAREGRSFLTEQEEVYPAPTGLRGLLARLGIRSGPTEAERRTRAQERAVSQLWPGTRTIAVLNGKGGAGKTPTTILLSALFARYGGSGVLAWDNNVTRGTLGWRTEQGPHEATVLDLLPHTDDLLSPSARAADLAAFVHHQTVDKFDVLRSNPLLLSTEQKITPAQLDAIHAVAAKYYRLVFMDSGNDEGDALWLRMVDHADHIVVATTTRTDHAEAARLLLDALHDRDERSAQLATNASVIVSQADREEKSAESIAEAFAGIAPSVTTIPYDPAMRQQWLRHDALTPASRAAWLSAAASVAARL